MNLRKHPRRRALLALPAALALTPIAALAAYPERAVRLVLPFGPGSATDTLMRLVAEPLAAALGQSVVIDNRPGALTTLALDHVAKSAPDGYTLVAATNSIVANPAGVQRNVPFDPFRDFTPITRLAATSYVLVVAADKPWKTIGEFFDHARANPGKLNYGSGNLGGVLYGGMLARSIGVEMTHVPYKSTPPALIDLIGGQVQWMFTDVVTASAQVKGGKVRALLATALQRTALFPDVPTIAEAGLRGIADMPAWFGLFGPAGLPAEAVERLNREVTKVLNQPDLRARLLALGLEATPSTPQALAAFAREQSQSYVRLIKEFGIQPE
ncbi:MAG: tripartite tricarboxylate transporter substrate binding protein [Burkholderiaceae bacterium]|nr:tripartite tricarboxylate transporter substrate binding protein [Burkholderiaceae bacterium]